MDDRVARMADVVSHGAGGGEVGLSSQELADITLFLAQPFHQLRRGDAVGPDGGGVCCDSKACAQSTVAAEGSEEDIFVDTCSEHADNVNVDRLWEEMKSKHAAACVSPDPATVRHPTKDVVALEGTAWSQEYHHLTSRTIGDVQRSLPHRDDELNKIVKYKGPVSKNTVMKQATTNQELQKAIEAGDADLVAALLRYGAVKHCVNVNCPLWPKRERFLHLAARRNHREICMMLLEARADMDDVEVADGKNPLHEACSSGSYDVVELLLDRRARMEENTFVGMRPLHFAAAAGRVDVVDFLLDRDAKITAVSSSNNFQALHHAARNGHAQVVGLLCQRRANVDATAFDRRPLELACLGGHTRAALMLADLGALSVYGAFNPGGLLMRYQDSELEEVMRTVDQLRLQRDEAEELHDIGQDASQSFGTVVAGFARLGMDVSAKGAFEDATSCGIELDLALLSIH
mmetsp:Transcript_50635/g.134863  ORF Transcript_50635/g.134863 Transcript_50635/m.134863 type:complete len:462 (-) Transcript_50635:87-1472(-)|eukprot:CAMPEP_0194532042 /NCGR_PEP_ID=MMETSP0253-20130528/69488_1 /TAXON_ID=2966 /ORGANISM="Noctiluca scintillans" /LENGTH=461 /DNA_ID=CAMNT_0039377443 /DNA_START=69 /DNA_END=1454 /DNA_ORIENTATION=-